MLQRLLKFWYKYQQYPSDINILHKNSTFTKTRRLAFMENYNLNTISKFHQIFLVGMAQLVGYNSGNEGSPV